MITTAPRRALGIAMNAPQLRRLLATAHELDIDKGGLFDGRGALIQIWCSPEDKPRCWNTEIDSGGLNYPRCFVGVLSWLWPKEGEQASTPLYIEVDASELSENKGTERFSDEIWEELFRWVREKSLALVALSEQKPNPIGIHCPFCAWILPMGTLMNDLIDHIGANHKGVNIKGVILGGETGLQLQMADGADVITLLTAYE